MSHVERAVSDRAGELTIGRGAPTSLENRAFADTFNRLELERFAEQEVRQATLAGGMVLAMHEATRSEPGVSEATRSKGWRRGVAATAAAIGLSIAALPEPAVAAEASAVQPSNPYGFLDYAAREQRADGKSYIVLRGWAIDPDSPTAPEIHIWRDGEYSAAAGQVVDRPDVGAAYPGAQRKGYDIALEMDTADTTNHKFCTYAINSGTGDTNTELGCAYVGIQDPHDINQLAADQTWVHMEPDAIIERVKREYVNILTEMREMFADEGLDGIMPEIAWFEAAFGTNPDAYSESNVYKSLLQIDGSNGDLMLVNPYYSIVVAQSILDRQGLGAWPNTSRMVLSGRRSSHIFHDGTPAPEV